MDRCSWNSTGPSIVAGSTSFKSVRMIGVGRACRARPDRFAVHATPAPTPSRPIASRLVNAIFVPQTSYFVLRTSYLRNLKQPSRPHAAADAHGDDDAFGAAALAFDERVSGEALTGHAVRMADRDRA